MMRQRQTRSPKMRFRVRAQYDADTDFGTSFVATVRGRSLLDATRRALKMAPGATHIKLRRVR